MVLAGRTRRARTDAGQWWRRQNRTLVERRLYSRPSRLLVQARPTATDPRGVDVLGARASVPEHLPMTYHLIGGPAKSPLSVIDDLNVNDKATLEVLDTRLETATVIQA